MPNRYPVEQRQRATRMALQRLDEYGSAWAAAQALGPDSGVGSETFTSGCCRPRPTPDSGRVRPVTSWRRSSARLEAGERRAARG